METNLGQPNTPVNVGSTTVQPVVVQPTVQVVRTAQNAEMQNNATPTQPGKQGWQAMMNQVVANMSAAMPWSTTRQLNRIAQNPTFAAWNAKKGEPPVPAMTDMMPEPEEGSQGVANPFFRGAPSPGNYQYAMDWVSAHAAHEGYGKYSQNPVPTDWFMLGQLRDLQFAENRNALV